MSTPAFDRRSLSSRRSFVKGAAALGLLGILSPAFAYAASSSKAADATTSEGLDAATGLANVDEAILKTNDDGTRVMNDQLGEITVAEESKRLATTAPAHTTGVLLLGGADKLVALEENFGKNDWIKGKYPQLADLPVVFSSNETNMEELLNTKPDLVLYASRYGEETRKQLQDLDITCLTGLKQDTSGNYDHIYAVRDNAVYWGMAIGGTQMEKAQKFREEYTSIRELIQQRTQDLKEADRPTVVEISSAGDQLQVNNGSAIGQELIDLCGGINAAKDASGESAGPSGQTIIDPEQLLDYNPDILLVDRPAYLQALQDDPILSELKAIKSGRTYIVPSGAMSWSYNGPEEYPNMWFFAKAIQPEIFGDVDMEQVTRAFYQDFFGFELDGEDIAYLFSLEDGQTLADIFAVA